MSTAGRHMSWTNRTGEASSPLGLVQLKNSEQQRPIENVPCARREQPSLQPQTSPTPVLHVDLVSGPTHTSHLYPWLVNLEWRCGHFRLRGTNIIMLEIRGCPSGSCQIMMKMSKWMSRLKVLERHCREAVNRGPTETVKSHEWLGQRERRHYFLTHYIYTGGPRTLFTWTVDHNSDPAERGQWVYCDSDSLGIPGVAGYVVVVCQPVQVTCGEPYLGWSEHVQIRAFSNFVNSELIPTIQHHSQTWCK